MIRSIRIMDSKERFDCDKCKVLPAGTGDNSTDTSQGPGNRKCNQATAPTALKPVYFYYISFTQS